MCFPIQSLLSNVLHDLFIKIIFHFEEFYYYFVKKRHVPEQLIIQKKMKITDVTC